MKNVSGINKTKHFLTHVSYRGGHLGVVKVLLRCGVHVDAVDAHGWSAMYYAGMAGHGAIVEALLERSASVDIRDVCGWNALTVACAYGHLPVVLRLLEEYPDEAGTATCLRKASRSIDAQSTSGETAFWWACYFDHAQVVSVAVRAKVRVPPRTVMGLPRIRACICSPLVSFMNL